MRYRIRRLVACTSMILAVSLSASVMARAQAPAGPNRPPLVPEEYVVTPFGYFHPSCVVHLAEGEELLEGDERLAVVTVAVEDNDVGHKPELKGS